MVKEPNLKPSMLNVIKAKTLVVNGNKDMIRICHAKTITKNIPNAELKIVNGDHFYLFKKPNEFNSLVMEFLQNKITGDKKENRGKQEKYRQK